MACKVSIQAILEAFEIQGEDSLSFVHLDTGEVETVSRDLMGMAEESDEMPDMPAWQEPAPSQMPS